MTDRRPIAISIVILTIAIVIFAASLFTSPNRLGFAGSNNSQGSGSRGSGTRGSHSTSDMPDMERGSIEASNKLPQDIELLDASTSGEVSGKVLCGNCTYETGVACNVMIYNETARQLVRVLQNENYDGLNALIGST